MKIIIFANTFYLVSGGDVIFAELAKAWQKSFELKVVTNEKGKSFSVEKGVSPSNIHLQKSSYIDFLPLLLVELYKSLISSLRELFTKRDADIIFSSSFFWPDIVPAVIAKIKNPKAKLVIGIYLLFPPPLSFKKYHGGQLKLLFLYLCQSLSLVLTRFFADLVLTASVNDLDKFKTSSLAIRGGVDMQAASKLKVTKKKYDLVYFGRFHSQKGILDMLKIWKKIKQVQPKTKFLMMGGGPMEEEIKDEVKRLGLQNSITFSGVVGGSNKFKLLKSSKVFTSASRFDTGNMALDEALSCGVPGVVYDLPHMHYPKGVIKVSIGNKVKMRKEIKSLLSDSKKRNRLGREGKEFIKNYDWKNTSQKILKAFS